MLKLYKFNIKTALISCKLNFHISKEAGINLMPQAIILPKINKFLYVVAEMGPNGQDQLLDSLPTGYTTSGE